MAQQYNNDSIKALTDREAIRLRIGNYTSTDGLDGAFHIVRETVNNSLDEYKANNNYDKVYLTYHKDDSFTIQDFARGIPCDWNESEQVFNYFLIFEKLNAGGKFNSENYRFSTGLNGQGNTIMAMSSEFAEIEICRDGFKYILNYKKGILQDKLQKIKLVDKSTTGTRIHWKSDLEVFTDVKIPKQMIIDYLSKQAIINKGVHIYFIDEHDDTSFEYYFENGIVTYVENENKDNITEVQYWETTTRGRDRDDKEDYDCLFQIAFCFNKNKPNIECYHNSAVLKYGGSPLDAIKNGFAYAINKFLADNKLYNKNESKIKFEDIEENLFIISNTYSTYSVYMNQTKTALTNEFVKSAMTTWIRNQLEIYLIENKLEAEKIAQKVLLNKRVRERGEQTKLDIRKKLESSINVVSKIEGLIECKSKNKNENILCICEGKSALSAMISGRQDIHALFPIRGKILNCLKAPLDKIMNSDVVVNLIKALGCGIELKTNKKDMSTFDIHKLRYSKIYIYVDADFDGMGSILPLLLTVFWKLTPTLVKEGRIYVCETPKYEVVVGDDYYYAVDDEELVVLQKKLKDKKYNLHYIKGLSELSASTMAMCLKPSYKNITQVGLDDVQKSIEMLELFMGDEISPRRDYILNHFDDKGD